MARHSTKAIEHWGRRPFYQPHKWLRTGEKLHSSMSGLLFIPDSDVSVFVEKCKDGISFAFDARGHTITITLPVGEVTQLGDNVFTIEGVASITRAGGVWTYAGN